jgi:hypothetical protein
MPPIVNQTANATANETRIVYVPVYVYVNASANATGNASAAAGWLQPVTAIARGSLVQRTSAHCGMARPQYRVALPRPQLCGCCLSLSDALRHITTGAAAVARTQHSIVRCSVRRLAHRSP